MWVNFMLFVAALGWAVNVAVCQVRYVVLAEPLNLKNLGINIVLMLAASYFFVERIS